MTGSGISSISSDHQALFLIIVMKDIILEYIFLEMQSVFLLYCISASWNILSVVMQFQILLRSLCFLIMLEGWPEPCVQIPNGEQNINWTLLVWCSLLQGSPTGVCLSDLCLRPTSCIKTSGPRPRRMTDCCNPWPVFTLQSHVTTVPLFPLLCTQRHVTVERSLWQFYGELLSEIVKWDSRKKTSDL